MQSSLCAAITGRVPNYGYLLDENRKGNILVKVQAKIEDDFDYQLLGCCAKKIGFGSTGFYRASFGSISGSPNQSRRPA